MDTKTVINPYTHEEQVLVGCDCCGQTGKYWREEIFSWWPCNKCRGHGCLTIDQAQVFVTHADPDGPYRPRKGVA